MAETDPSVWMMIGSVLPYPDPLRRRRVRREARRLVQCDPWPGDDATPFDVAQLALLRLLWLQRETRSVASRQQPDAAALLARTSAETCLAGLYWLLDDAQIERMRGHNARSFRTLFSPVADGDPISPDLLKNVSSAIGEETRLPSLEEMAEKVVEKTGESFARDIYEGLYKALSTVVAHPTGLTLLRHVDSRDRLKDRPTPAWSVRSAQHTVDACMAVLSRAVAEYSGQPVAIFQNYADAHLSRTISPLGVISGRAMIEGLRLAKLPQAVRMMVKLRRYLHSEDAATSSFEERKAEAELTITEVMKVFGGGSSPPYDVLVDYFANEVAGIPEERQRPPSSKG